MTTTQLSSVNLAPFQDLLAQLIAEPSVSSPQSHWDQSNERVIAVLETWFRRLGFKTEVQAVPEAIGKFNLLATLGEGTQGLVLAGHSDTVPYDQARWASDPFTLSYRDERFYGLGSCDMKGFFPIIVEALKGLEGAQLTQPLIVLATADEESTMAGARAIAQRGGLPARAAVIGEPTSVKPVRMHKGMMMECIRVTGRAGHSSNPSLGRSALEDMHIVIAELLKYRQHLQQRYRNDFFEVSVPTMNLGHVHGGDSPNRICGHCELSFDIRPLPGMATAALRRELQAVVKGCVEQHHMQLDYKALIDSVEAFETPASAELVKVCEDFTGAQAHAVAFATEAPFMSAMGFETVVMGAGSIDQAHQPNEFLAAAEVPKMSKVLQSLIRHYCIT